MNKERRKIYEKTNGKCYYCGCELPKKWHADHIDPILRRSKLVKCNPRERILKGSTYKIVFTGEVENPEAENIDNKVPACPRCNIRKSTMDIETFRSEIKAQVERLLRDSNQFNLALDYGLIEIKDKPVEFYFEKSSHSSILKSHN